MLEKMWYGFQCSPIPICVRTLMGLVFKGTGKPLHSGSPCRRERATKGRVGNVDRQVSFCLFVLMQLGRWNLLAAAACVYELLTTDVREKQPSKNPPPCSMCLVFPMEQGSGVWKARCKVYTISAEYTRLAKWKQHSEIVHGMASISSV